MLKQLAELVDGEPSIAYDAAHGDGVDWVVSGDGNPALAIGHYDVLALAQDAKACFLQRADCRQMIYARKLRHN